MINGFSSLFYNKKNSITTDELNSFCESLYNTLANYGIVEQFVGKICSFIKDEFLKYQSSTDSSTTKTEQMEYLIELTRILLFDALGESNSNYCEDLQELKIVLIVGFCGVGKTSFSGKLTNSVLKFIQKDKIAVSSIDNQRPAAQKQLKLATDRVGVEFIDPNFKQNNNVVEAFNHVLVNAVKNNKTLLIVDTFGINIGDSANILQLNNIQKLHKNIDTILVADNMIGRNTLLNIKKFAKSLKINGVVITKTDNDSGIGCIINTRIATETPVKYITNGENINALEKFNRKKYCKLILESLNIGNVFATKLPNEFIF